MAYLNTVPRQSRGGMVAARVSRLQQLLEDGSDIAMPPVSGAGQPLLAQFLEVGPVSHSGMGATPLPFAELRAYAHMVGLKLLPWEARLLRRLSAEYVGESQRAEKHDATPPWAPSRAVDRENVSQRVRALFGARAKTKGRAS